MSENQKIAKAIGPDAEDVLKELEAADTEELNKRIAQASEAIASTKKELGENPEYVQAKEDVKLLSSGFREVKQRQNAIIKLCLNLRRDRGAA
jgi:predicted translin family RNA/ssDNA-binding protein